MPGPAPITAIIVGLSATAALVVAAGVGYWYFTQDDDAQNVAASRGLPIRVTMPVTSGEGPFQVDVQWTVQPDRSHSIRCDWTRISGGKPDSPPAEGLGTPASGGATFQAVKGPEFTEQQSFTADPQGRPGTYQVVCRATPGPAVGKVAQTFVVPLTQTSRAEGDGDAGTRLVFLPTGGDGGMDGMDGGGGCCGAGDGGMDGTDTTAGGPMDHQHGPGGEFGGDAGSGFGGGGMDPAHPAGPAVA